jgi:hypothetical protein
MHRLYGGANEELNYIIRDWDNFAAEAPQSDDVEEYIRDKPMHVPLYDFLFNPTPLSAERTAAVLHSTVVDDDEQFLDEVRATASVVWDGKQAIVLYCIQFKRDLL